MTASVSIYTRAWCGYCTAAVSLLRSKGVPFEQIDVAGDVELRRWLRETTGRHTVPQVFIDGTPIGGYTDLRRLDERGELDKLLWDRPAAERSPARQGQRQGS